MLSDYPDVWNGYKNVSKTKTPLYIIHSKSDNIIPFEMGKKLAKTAGGKAQFLALENAGHNDVYILPNDNTWQPFFEFIDERN